MYLAVSNDNLDYSVAEYVQSFDVGAVGRTYDVDLPYNIG